MRVPDLNFFLKTFLSLLVIFLIGFAGVLIGVLISDHGQSPGGDGVAVVNIDGIIIDPTPILKA